jgi:hypothetical protein
LLDLRVEQENRRDSAAEEHDHNEKSGTEFEPDIPIPPPLYHLRLPTLRAPGAERTTVLS